MRVAWMVVSAMIIVMSSVATTGAVERGDRPSKKSPYLASSTVKVNTKATYGPEKAFDGRTDTAWCEGVKGNGVGQWIAIYLGDAALMGGPQDVTVHLSRGFQKDWGSYEENGRPIGVTVELFANDDLIAKASGKAEHAFAEIVLKNVPAAKGDLWLRTTIDKVAPGTKYQDTCLSEVRPAFAKANPHHVREFVKRVCLMINQPKTHETNRELKALVKKIRKEFINDFEEPKVARCSPDGFNVLSQTEFELWGAEGGDGATILRFDLKQVVWELKATGYFTAWD
jgi:hypothetical protein